MSNADGPSSDASARPRVVFLGMPCAFSAPPLAALVAAGMDVAAVVLPGPPGEVAFRWHRPPGRTRPGIALTSTAGAAGGPSLMGIAATAGMPLLFVASIRSAAVVAEIARLRPDAIAVACFPGRLPAALLRLSPLGALNLHPSLLPRDRGPSPLFWAFHRGADETGVTVHLMEETLDAGPILRQRAVAIPEGIQLADLELDLARLGGALLAEAIRARAEGDLAETAQDAALATSASFPTASDAVIDPATWSARRALRFVRGVRSATVRLPNGDLVPVEDASWWEPATGPQTPTTDAENALVAAFADGQIAFRLARRDRTGRPPALTEDTALCHNAPSPTRGRW